MFDKKGPRNPGIFIQKGGFSKNWHRRLYIWPDFQPGIDYLVFDALEPELESKISIAEGVNLRWESG